MKIKLKKLVCIAVCTALAAGMLITSASAVTFNTANFATGDGYTKTVDNVKVPITMTAQYPDGTSAQSTPKSIASVKASGGAATSELPESLVVYQIPEVEISEVDLLAVDDTLPNGTEYKNYDVAEGTEGFVVEKVVANKDKTVEAGTVVGTAKIVTSFDTGVKSNDRGTITASAVWRNYLFLAMTFADTYNAEYYTNLVVYSLNDFSAPIAEWNLSDLGLMRDMYEVLENEVYTQTLGNTGNWQGTPYREARIDREEFMRVNTLDQAIISSICVTDTEIFLAIGESNGSYNGSSGDARRNNARLTEFMQFANPINKSSAPGDDVAIGEAKAHYKGKINNANVSAEANIANMEGNRTVMAVIENKLIIVNAVGNKYYCADLSGGKIETISEPVNLVSVCAEGLNSSSGFSITDADFEGNSLYITARQTNGQVIDSDGKRREKGNVFVIKLDINDPMAPKLEYRFAHEDYLTLPSNVGYWCNQELEISGTYGYLLGGGNKSAGGSLPWLAVLDMSNRATEITEVACYDIADLYSTHNEGNSYRKIVSIGDYIFLPTGAGASKRSLMGVMEFSKDKKSVLAMDTIATSVRISDGVVPYGVMQAKNYGGNLYTFYADPFALNQTVSENLTTVGAVFGRMSLGAVNPYISEIYTPYMEDGNLVISGRIIKSAETANQKITKLNIDINGTVDTVEVESDKTWHYEIEAVTLEYDTKYMIKVYPTFKSQAWDEDKYIETDNGMITVVEDMTGNFDYTEFEIAAPEIGGEAAVKIYSENFENVGRSGTKLTGIVFDMENHNNMTAGANTTVYGGRTSGIIGSWWAGGQGTIGLNLPENIEKFKFSFEVHFKASSKGHINSVATGKVTEFSEDKVLVPIMVDGSSVYTLDDNGSKQIIKTVSASASAPWYEVEYIVDVANRTYTVTLENGTEATYSFKGEGTADLLYVGRTANQGIVIMDNYVLDTAYDVPLMIDSVSYNADTNKATVSYSSTAIEPISGRVIAALYNKGRLIDVTYSDEDITLTEGTAMLTAPASWKNIAGTKIKLFVWENGTIRPLADVIEHTN